LWRWSQPKKRNITICNLQSSEKNKYAIFSEWRNLPALTGHGVASKFSSVTYNRFQAGCYLTVDQDFKELISSHCHPGV
jgi:hypothetical protein